MEHPALEETLPGSRADGQPPWVYEMSIERGIWKTKLKSFNAGLANLIYVSIWVCLLLVWIYFALQSAKSQIAKGLESFLIIINFLSWAALLVLMKLTSVGMWLRKKATKAQRMFINTFHFLFTTYCLLPFGTLGLVVLILQPIKKPGLEAIFNSLSTLGFLVVMFMLISGILVGIWLAVSAITNRLIKGRE